MNIVHRFSFNQKTGKRALDILHLEHVPYESNGSDIVVVKLVEDKGTEKIISVLRRFNLVEIVYKMYSDEELEKAEWIVAHPQGKQPHFAYHML